MKILIIYSPDNPFRYGRKWRIWSAKPVFMRIAIISSDWIRQHIELGRNGVCQGSCPDNIGNSEVFGIVHVKDK